MKRIHTTGVDPPPDVEYDDPPGTLSFPDQFPPSRSWLRAAGCAAMVLSGAVVAGLAWRIFAWAAGVGGK